MKVKKILGFILIIFGTYLMFNVYESSLPIIYGSKVKADIIGIDSIKDKRFKFVFYPIFKFSHKNQTIKITDHSNSVDKSIVNSNLMVYYDDNYGMSRGFTVDKVIFLIISILFLFFGAVCMMKF